MKLINEFIGFLIDRHLKEDEPKQMPDKGVDKDDLKRITMHLISDNLELRRRVEALEKKVYLPSERSYTRQSECSKSNLRSEWESRNFFE